MRRVAALLVATVLWPAAATSADGVLEINQTCAVQTGCFADDDPGFPVTIATSGSYVLTSNLTVSNPYANGISVTGSEVRIDLNGFEIAGPVTCTGSGSALVCSPTGFGRGIRGSGYNRAQVRGGAVRGFASGGIHDIYRVEDVRASENGGNGIKATMVTSSIAEQNVGYGIEADMVSDSMARWNAVDGIDAHTATNNVASYNGRFGLYAYGLLRDNRAHGNEGDGLRCKDLGYGCIMVGNASKNNAGDGLRGWYGAVAQGNTAANNNGGGIVVGNAATVKDNSVTSNGGNGIEVGLGATISGNSVMSNTGNGIETAQGAMIDGNSVNQNSGDGILANSSSVISGNTLRANGGFGLFFFGSQSAYRGNTISVNGGGTVGFGTGNTAVNTGQNLCNGGLTCP